MSNKCTGLFFIPILFLQISCSKKESSTSSSSPVPSMVAIAKSSLPVNLESTAVGFNLVEKKLLTADADLAEMKTRLFSPGPTDFMFRLNSVDDRLDSLADAILACESVTTTTFTPPAIAAGFSFPMEFSCVQTIDATSLGVSDFKVYFGKSGGHWYIAEIQTNAQFSSSDGEPPTMAVLSKINENGEEMEVFQISVEYVSGINHATITHIKANKTDGIFELSSASSAYGGLGSTQVITPGANYTGLGCGIKMITDSNYVYGSGEFGQNSTCPSSSTPCGTAANLNDAPPGSCGYLVALISTLTLDRASIDGDNAKSLVVDRTWLSGL